MLKEKLSHTETKIQMYSRYVDDIDIVCTAVSNAVGTEMPDESTMKMVQHIANSIHESIQVTIDFPSNHENGRMPVLDTEQWMEKVNVNGAMKNQVLHSHYMKKISSKHLINKGSALSNEMKSNVLVADLVRVMRNVSLKCSKEERMQHIQHFVNRMQFSGYTQHDRVNTYKRAKGIFDKMVQRDQEGECPLYRGKFWQREERQSRKEEKKHTWYQKRDDETVVFVDATPHGQLAKECRQALKESQIKIKVIEKAGKSLKRCLCRSDPFRFLSCDNEKCHLCKIGSNVNCKSRELVYEMKCQGCQNEKGMYIGETARSIGERVNEHITGYENKSKNSVFHRHVVDEHQGIPQEIEIKVLASCRNDAMLRQVTEAVCIKELKPMINMKEEWGNTNNIRERRNKYFDSKNSKTKERIDHRMSNVDGTQPTEETQRSETNSLSH